MKKSIFSFVFILLLIGGCSSSKEITQTIESKTPVHPTLYATLYVQQAAEYKALCYQTFNFASLRLNAEMKQTHSKPLAIVVDVDETVLDNSPYQAAAILGNFGYPIRWSEWMNAAAAQPIPGALAFLQEASKLGVKVFYVTNRRETFRAATLQNLIELGFPDAVNENLMLRDQSAEKETRRLKIMETYEIVLLVGDNLADFSHIFENVIEPSRTEQTELNKSEFGKKWFVLPNPVYGNWVDVLPGYNKNLAPAALNDSLLKGLKDF